MIRQVVSRLAAVALFIGCGAAHAQSLSASASSINFSYPQFQTTTLEQGITVYSTQTTGFYNASITSVSNPNLVNNLTVTPSSGLINSSGTLLTVRLTNPGLITTPATARLNVSLSPFSLSSLDIPINIYPGGTVGTGSFVATPASVVIPYVPGSTQQSQTISLTAPVNVSVTPSFDTSLSPYLSLNPSILTSQSTFTIILNSAFAPSGRETFGNLYLTPATGSGLGQIAIPITLRPSNVPGTGSNITASPTAITFNFAAGTTTSQRQTVTVSAPVSVQMTAGFTGTLGNVLSVPSTINSNSSFEVVLSNPASVTQALYGNLVLNPAVGGTGLQPLSIPISVVPGGTTGTLSVNPAGLTYNFNIGSTSPISLTAQTSAPTTETLTATLSSNLTNLIQVPSSVSSNQQFTVTLINPALVTVPVTGTITLTPPAGSTLNSATVTIQLNPGGFNSGGLSASPATLAYNYIPGSTSALTQYLLLSSPITSTVTITPSSNIAAYLSYPSTVLTGQQIAITLNNPSFVPSGTSGTLTFTPSAGGLGPITVPVSFNGSSVGTGAVTASPASVSFSMQLNGAAPPEQSVTVTSTGATEQITMSVNSENNFLILGQSSGTTPATVSLRVNPSAVNAIGTYSATVNIYRINTTVLLATIPVTLNVTQAVQVTANPAAANLTSFVGATSAATQSVALSSPTSGSFTTNVSTRTGGNWLSVTPSTGSLGSSITINANASGLTAGTYTGTVSILVNNAVTTNIPVTFTVAPASALQLSSTNLTFNHLTSNTAAPAAQTVNIGSSTSGVALGYTATATSAGNWLAVTPANGTTPGSVSVSVNPTGLVAGTYNGTVSIASSAASNSPQTINVTLNVTAPALPNVTSVLSAASLAPTVTTPGLILTLRGANMGPADGVSGSVMDGMLSTNLGGVTVTFDGVPAPLLYVSATQINLVAPYEVASRASTRMVITYNGIASRESELRVGDTAPALFTSTGGGTGQAAALNQNGSVNSASNPEARGNVIVLFGTGEGLTNPGGVTGQVVPATGLRRPIANVIVRIGGQLAEVLYAGSMPNAVAGAFQLNVRIPQSIGSGAQPVDVQIGTGSSQSAVTIAVQ